MFCIRKLRTLKVKFGSEVLKKINFSFKKYISTPFFGTPYHLSSVIVNNTDIGELTHSTTTIT